MLYISRNVILERELLIHLKINPPHTTAESEESPFLVTHSIKNRSTLVLYKVMIRKGLQTLKNEQNVNVGRKNENNESADPANVEPTQKKKPKKRFNNVFAQSI